MMDGNALFAYLFAYLLQVRWAVAMAITKVLGKKIDPVTRKPVVKYRVRVQLPADPETGKRSSIVRVVSTEREAKTTERRLLQEVETGKAVLPDSITVADLLHRWLEAKRGSITDNSYRDYQNHIDRHITPALGKVKVQRLTTSDVQRQMNQWRDEGMGSALLTSCRQRLSSALDMAARQGIVYSNVVKSIERMRVSRSSRPDAWSREEVQAFLSRAKSMPIRHRGGDSGQYSADALWPIWPLLVLEGMRRSEALGLRWRDVDLDAGRAHIVQTVIPDKSDKGKAIIRVATKTAGSARTVALTTYTVAALREHRDKQAFMRKRAGDDWVDTDLIICTRLGTPINPRNVQRSMERIIAVTVMENGSPLRRITVHGLRHTAATLALRGGANLKFVSERLGHSSIKVTADVYSHVSPDMQRQVANVMDAMVLPNREGVEQR